jgi:hypothetical protein
MLFLESPEVGNARKSESSGRALGPFVCALRAKDAKRAYEIHHIMLLCSKKKCSNATQ